MLRFWEAHCSFLPELRKRFVETLKLEKHQVISPSNAQLYVALGAALASKKVQSDTF